MEEVSRKKDIQQWFNLTASGYIELHGDEQVQKIWEILSILPRVRGLVVDIGCGPGFLAKHGRFDALIGVDLSVELLRIALSKARLHTGYVCADAEILPLRSSIASCAFAVTLLSVTPNPVRCIEEMLRVLRPGGLLVITCFRNDLPHVLQALLLRTHRVRVVDPGWGSEVILLCRRTLA